MKYFLLTILLVTSLSYAHPGRTDGDGGHTCRTKCKSKWGLEPNSYHLHAPKKAKTAARKEVKKRAKTSKYDG